MRNTTVRAWVAMGGLTVLVSALGAPWKWF